ncbi:MAG TPA: hypothetical protein VJK30_03635 [Coxiellaceae bacterium]|nr:MAG: hypothetical protein A3E81_07120 [Gammaproteobacteria bacterium RIFCSPHIGHO2_12_FULL_36_30]HLB56403.1 hypothetical protein [Coxiellaceae bacterium]
MSRNSNSETDRYIPDSGRSVRKSSVSINADPSPQPSSYHEQKARRSPATRKNVTSVSSTPGFSPTSQSELSAFGRTSRLSQQSPQPSAPPTTPLSSSLFSQFSADNSANERREKELIDYFSGMSPCGEVPRSPTPK